MVALANLWHLFKKSDAHRREDIWIFGTMLLSAILSLIAALVLSVESYNLAKDPSAELSCSVNVLINCASVMKHPSADLFGFPNSYIGLIAEPIVITVAIAGLYRIKFPRSFMAIAQLGYLAGLIFAYYLFFLSVFVIQALCPWCLLVTVSTTLVFMSLLRYNIRENNLYFSDALQERAKKFVDQDFDKFVTVAWLAAMTLLILLKYRDGLFT